MTLTGMKKHVGVLEQAGLVTTEKVGREQETAWIERYRQLWAARFDELDEVVEELTSAPMKNQTTMERKSERELVVTRTFNAPARIVFEAWTKPELLKRWWAPKSTGMTLLSCEMDVRVGGKYRLAFGLGGSKPMEFFGRYIEVTPPSRLVWTNEEGGDSGPVSTATFEERDGKTLLILREAHEQLDELLATLAIPAGS